MVSIPREDFNPDLHDKYRVFLLRFPIQHRDSGLPVTYCGRLTIPILLWFGAQTRKRRSIRRNNGAPAAVSSSIPNSGRRREGWGEGGKARIYRQRRRPTYREGSIVSVRGGFLSPFRRHAKRTDDRVGEIGHPQRDPREII